MRRAGAARRPGRPGRHGRHVRPGRLALAAALVGACTPTASPEPELELVDLVDNAAWSATPEAADPWASHRPASFDCQEFFGWRTSLTGELDVEMLDCDYLGLEQALARDLPAGTTLHLALYYFDLSAEQAATSHMAVAFGQQTAWELEVQIPGGDAFAPGAVREERFELAQGVSAGTQIRLHMHNHGQNSYVFVHLRAELPVGGETG